MLLKPVSIRLRAPKVSPAKSVHVTVMAATVRLVVTALNKASVKSAQCVKHLLPKRKLRVSPASLILLLKQELP